MNKKHTLKPDLLAIIHRGKNIECLHYGWICVLSNNKIILKKGDISNPVLLRSCAKPIQAIPITKNNIEITNEELAIACGSHSGSSKHIKVLKSLIKKNDLHISDLKCGIHLPIDEKEKIRLIRNGLPPNPLHNNCSGKHLGMLAVCKKNNWDLKSYLSPDHPLQKAILKEMKELSETSDISIAIDGCGASTFGLPVFNIAKLFSNFSQIKNKKYTKIISAMSQNPFLISGARQLDTEIIKKSHGKLIAKSGAEGIIVVFYKGNCIVVKIADGSPRARSFVVLKLLVKLGWLNKKEIKNSILEEILNGEIKNLSGVTVGSMY